MNDSRGPDWLALDNAAKIYPPNYSDHAPEVFRVGVTLTELVRFEPLERALARTIYRFPYYQVHLRRGLFWYYLQKHETPPFLEPLGREPVSRIRMRSQTAQLFRVFVRGRDIRIDFSHVLTDGSGAFRFLSTLVAEYLRQRGVSVPSEGPVMDPDEPPHATEFVDAYPGLYVPGTPKPDPIPPAYHIPGQVLSGYHRTLAGSMPMKSVLRIARGFKVSITELLASVYINAVFTIWKTASPRPRNRRFIRLQVPADMRRIHPSNTMRNFSLFVSPGIDLRLGDIDFESIVRTVHHTMALELDVRMIRRQIARNVGGEHLTIVRIIPLFLKDWYLSSLHHRLGGNIYSGVISNFGRAEFPAAMQNHVSDVSFVLGPNPPLKKAISVVSFMETLNIVIGSVIESRELERLFFTQLADLGVPVRIAEQESWQHANRVV